MLFAEVLEFFGCEIYSIIGDDAVRHPETEDDRSDEVQYSCWRHICDWHGFYPLGELVDYHQEVSMSTPSGFS